MHILKYWIFYLLELKTKQFWNFKMRYFYILFYISNEMISNRPIPFEEWLTSLVSHFYLLCDERKGRERERVLRGGMILKISKLRIFGKYYSFKVFALLVGIWSNFGTVIIVFCFFLVGRSHTKQCSTGPNQVMPHWTILYLAMPHWVLPYWLMLHIAIRNRRQAQKILGMPLNNMYISFILIEFITWYWTKK